jgi:hypothetical protein
MVHEGGSLPRGGGDRTHDLAAQQTHAIAGAGMHGSLLLVDMSESTG